MREICFDTETTGLDPELGDKITEIGCVEIIDRKITKNTFQVIINPERKNSLESIEITGLTDDILKDKPIFVNIVNDFLQFIGDSVLIAHNANFDIKFVNYELQHIGMEPLKNSVIDSLSLAKQKFPGKKNNLNALCERYNVDNSKREKHGALLDAELLSAVYLYLTSEEQTHFFSEENKEEEILEIENLIRICQKNKILPSRNFLVNEEELKIHNDFIAKNIKIN